MSRRYFNKFGYCFLGVFYQLMLPDSNNLPTDFYRFRMCSSQNDYCNYLDAKGYRRLKDFCYAIHQI